MCKHINQTQISNDDIKIKLKSLCNKDQNVAQSIMLTLVCTQMIALNQFSKIRYIIINKDFKFKTARLSVLIRTVSALDKVNNENTKI